MGMRRNSHADGRRATYRPRSQTTGPPPPTEVGARILQEEGYWKLEPCPLPPRTVTPASKAAPRYPLPSGGQGHGSCRRRGTGSWSLVPFLHARLRLHPRRRCTIHCCMSSKYHQSNVSYFLLRLSYRICPEGYMISRVAVRSLVGSCH